MKFSCFIFHFWQCELGVKQWVKEQESREKEALRSGKTEYFSYDCRCLSCFTRANIIPKPMIFNKRIVAQRPSSTSYCSLALSVVGLIHFHGPARYSRIPRFGSTLTSRMVLDFPKVFEQRTLSVQGLLRLVFCEIPTSFFNDALNL